MANIYYGVSQFIYGHKYRWIYEESVLQNMIYNGKPVPASDCIDCYFPFGGCNSSATFIRRLDTDDEIKAFLVAPGTGPDTDDPTLFDIGEYLLTVSDDYDSCTDQFMQKFGLSYDELKQTDDIEHRKQLVEDMFNDLQKAGYAGLDYTDPFYGENRNMRFSELCLLHKSNT